MTDTFLKELYAEVAKIARAIFGRIPAENSISMQSLYDQVFEASMQQKEWMWLIDLFVNETNGQLTAIFSKEGLLFESVINIDGSSVSLGELFQVGSSSSISKNSILIKRQSSGVYRWFLVSSSSVLNRNGAIDSEELFDNMARRCETSGKYPYLTFCHLPELKMGMSDWIQRDGHLLLASGLFDSSDYATMMRKAYESDPSYWGASVSFWPFAGAMEEISQSVFVPVYKDGELEEISILPEKMACCLFTALKSGTTRKVNDMREETKQAIKKLTADDGLAEELISTIDGINRSIEDNGLIHREASETPQALEEKSADSPVESPEPTAVESVSTEEKPVEDSSERVVEIDDEAMTEIVDRVVENPAMVKSFAEIQQMLASMTAQMNDMLAHIHNLEDGASKTTTQTEERFKKLENTSVQEKEVWMNDLPRNQVLRVTHRPRESAPVTEEKTAAQIAEETLSNIK